jgi:hypothetical protein
MKAEICEMAANSIDVARNEGYTQGKRDAVLQLESSMRENFRDVFSPAGNSGE